MADAEQLKREVEELKGKLEKAEAETERVKERAGKLEIESMKYEKEASKIKGLADHLDLERQKLLDKEAVRAEVTKENDALVSALKDLKTKDKVIVNASRRIDRFRGKPKTVNDPTVDEWIRDIKVQVSMCSLHKEDAVNFVLDHLAGSARLEILGRMDEVKDDPEKIYKSLRVTFGDGDTIPELLQKFFSYKQSGEDLVTCSINLLELFDKIAEVDKTFKEGKQSILKDRLAEAVLDEGLGRELRRLNIEVPDLSYFDLRDRAVKWIGRGTTRRTRVDEIASGATGDDMIEKIVEKVVKQLQKDQPPKMESRPPTRSKQQCWSCGSTEHLKRNCPKNENREVTSEAMYINDPDHLFKKAVGKRPEAEVLIGGRKCKCLIDTGAEVSTMTETFFNQNYDEELTDVSSYIKISAANGLSIPYVGYFEQDVEVMGRKFKAGFVVVKDPEDFSLLQRKIDVPGVVGGNFMNLLKEKCANITDKPPSKSTIWNHLLSLYADEHVSSRYDVSLVKLGESIVIPARSVKQVEAIVSPSTYGIMSAVVERHDACVRNFPVGFAVGRSVVKIDNSGRIPVQVANFGDKDILMKEKTRLGYATVVEENNRDITLSQSGENTVLVDLKQNDGNKDEQQVFEQIVKEIDVGEISSEQKDRFQEILLKHPDVFSKHEYDVGKSSGIEHCIKVTDDNPVKVPYRRIPPSQWQEVREYLKKALSQGIICESCSPYASPVVIVRKPNDDIRLCVDYRHLNAKTRKDANPLPRIEEALESLKGAKFFSTLYLAHGFHQIPVAKDDIEKTAFRVGTGGLYEFVCMPFGLCNAPATFMRMMDMVFGDQNFQTVLIYLDDILIPASSFEQMLERIDMVFTRLEKVCLKVKPDKCHFFKPSIKFLGHIVSEKGIATDPEKISAVKEWILPSTADGLKTFLGLTGY